jgi:hypothetical protein
MKNKVSVLVIYIENKPGAKYAQRQDAKIKSLIKNYQNYIDRFRCK